MLAVFSMSAGLTLLNGWTVDRTTAVETYHRGDNVGNAVWSGGEDHFVDDAFNVSWNTTLTIRAGARIFMDSSHGNGKIVVEGGGKLVIEGTYDDPVYITANTTNSAPGDYAGIVVENGGEAYMNHTYIGNATIGIDIISGNVEINHCVINNSLDWGIKFTGDGVPKINNCTVNNTGDGGVFSGGIHITSNCMVRDCNVFNSSNTGIYVSAGTPTIYRTNVHDTRGNGLRIMGSAIPTLKECNISDTWSENILVTGNTKTLEIENCTVGNWTNPGAGDTIKIENTDTTHQIHVVLLNSTYQNDTFGLLDYGNLTVKWYVNAIVNDSKGSPVAGANVSLTNSTGVVTDFKLTNNTGRADFLTGVEFIFNSSGFIYDKYYTVRVTRSGFAENHTEIWLDGFNFTTFTLNDTGAPTAEAGPGVTVDQGDLVTFDGGGSTDNVGVENYTWTFEDGINRTLFEVDPNYTFLNAGFFSVELNVTDAAGNWNTDSMAVTVNDTTDPVAVAGQDRNVDQGTNVTFNGSASTDNVGIDNFTWYISDGGARTLYGNAPTYLFHNAGVFDVTLNVTDSAGNWHMDNTTVTVNDTSEPVANAGVDRIVDQHANVTLNGSHSTDNVGIANFTWTFDDGGIRSLEGESAWYVFHNTGIYVITLNVADARGNRDTDNVTVTVNDTTDPVADAGLNPVIDQDTMMAFDGSGSTDNVEVSNYTWNFTDGTEVILYGSNPTFIFENAGAFPVTLKVTDAAGNGDTDIVVVIVNDTTDPVADAGQDRNLTVNTSFRLDGNGSTDNVAVVNYTWTFQYNGSNMTLYGEEADFKFEIVGNYTVTLEVTDAAGNADMDVMRLTVEEEKEGMVDDDDSDDDGRGGKEDGSQLWLWLLIVGIVGILIGGGYYLVDRGRKMREGRRIDEDEINKITAGRLDFIILRKPGTKKFKKYELHRIQGSVSDVAGIFWDTAKDSAWVVDRIVTGSREMAASKFEHDIKKNLEKGYSLDYFGSGLIIRLLGKWLR